MKKTLLFSLLLCLSISTGWSQTNLILNGSCDTHTGSTTDNADSYDMTPNSSIKDDGGTDVDSPYKYDETDNPNGWNNSDLASWLEANCGDGDEQPGSTSDGNWDYSGGADMGVKTRGVKLYEACRRLYQKVQVTAGKEYTLTLDSRSEAENVPSEVFMLNTEITSETGLSSSASTVDGYMQITNDFNSSKSNADTNNFTTNSFSFTASGDFVVFYVRAPLAVDGSNEVFYDNISLVEKETVAAGNTVTPLTAEFNKGYINTFNVSDDAYAFGFEYGVADMKTTIGATSVTLQPNFAIWGAEDGNTAWFDTSSGKTAKLYLEASTYVEPTGLNDSDLTFEGNVSAYTLDGAYSVVAFIKALDPNSGWATVVNETAALSATGDFSVSATGTQLAAGLVIQYGFAVTGVPADPANENALGSVVVGEKATANVDQEIFEGFKLYPNPTSKLLYISNDNTIERATIHNLLGQTVRKVSINDIKASVDVSDLTPGIYIVRVSNGANSISKKFIKN